MKSVEKAENLAELYRLAAEVYGDRPAFATRGGGKSFQAVSFRELYDMALKLSTALIDLGVEAREHVGLLADNRFEWILTDYAILMCGAADVPRGGDVTDGDITYILPHSEAKVLFVENKAVLDKVLKNKKELSGIRHIVMMDKDTKAEGEVLHLYDLLEKGGKLSLVQNYPSVR